MSAMPVFSVFTKPWNQPLPDLATFIYGLGFAGVELPVRPGFQVEPDNVEAGLVEAVRIFGDHGLAIVSIAGPTDERTIAACAKAGVRIIRMCVAIPADRGYLEHEALVQRDFARLVPELDRCGVTIGVQNHCDRNVANAMGTRHLIERFDPKHIAAVWDPAHCALDGEVPELAIDILWSHLCMVNLKNAIWQRLDDTKEGVAQFRHVWVPGRHGLCSWPTVVDLLHKRDYPGPICLTAEYSDREYVDQHIAEDIGFARNLFSR
jgi:sugar phosphate isomerase/epimerase